jgi:salicylate hydroxylase
VYILSRLLGSSVTTRSTLPFVLRAYEQVRLPRANKALMSTRTSRRALEFQEEYSEAGGEEIARSLTALTEWLWEGKGDPDDDVIEAKKLVEQYIASSARK